MMVMMGSSGVAQGLTQSGSAATRSVSGFVATTVNFRTNGTIDVTNVGTIPTNSMPPAWSAPAPQLSVGINYWVRATLNSGTLWGGSIGVWEHLNADVGYYVERNASIGANTANITVDIASDSAGANVLTSTRFEITAQVG